MSPSDGYYLEEPPNHHAAREALAPVLRAGRLSRFRALDVVCPKGHRLVEVVRTAAGLVVVGAGPLTQVEVETQGGTDYDARDPWGPNGPSAVSWEYDWERRSRSSRALPVCCFLESLHGPKAQRIDSVAVQCRCRTVYLDGGWLTEQLDARRRRVVYE